MLLNKKIFRKIFFGFNDKTFKRHHKAFYKRDKRRLYFHNFFLALERKYCSILFQSKLIVNIKKLKYLASVNRIFINGVYKTSYSSYFNTLDFVYYSSKIGNLFKDLSKVEYRNNFLVNTPDYSDNLFFKPYSVILKKKVKSIKKNSKLLLKISYVKLRKRFIFTQKWIICSYLIFYFILKESPYFFKLVFFFNLFLLKFFFLIKVFKIYFLFSYFLFFQTFYLLSCKNFFLNFFLNFLR